MSSTSEQNKQTVNKSQNFTGRTMDGWENSDAFAALRKLQENPRIKYIVIAAPADPCPACLQLVGTYPKNQVPELPFEACSHKYGCRAFYLPFIEEMYP